MTEVEIFANHYRKIGLNVTCISDQVNEFNKFEYLLKTPSHSWVPYFTSPQNNEQFDNLNWEKAVGVGTVTHYQNLIAFDIDGCKMYEFIIEILNFLGLPPNYEWVVETGGKEGYHIYFVIDKMPSIGQDFAVTKLNSKLFGLVYEPSFPDNPVPVPIFPFEKVEILWKTHVVLPPSLHQSGLHYKFVNCFIPSKRPALIGQAQIMDFIKHYADVDMISHGLSYYELDKFVKAHAILTEEQKLFE